jgi:hypothetical protein
VSEVAGPALTPELLAALAQRDLPARAGRALALVTVDPQGRPHPMLCSHLELRALDAGRLRVVVGAGSRTAAQLAPGRPATLILAEAGTVAYVKCRATGARSFGALLRVELAVEEVRLDRAGAEEGGGRITEGLRFAPGTPLDGPWARAVMEALAAD